MNIRPAMLSDVSSIVNLGKDIFALHASFDQEYYKLEDNFSELFSLWVKEQITHPYQFLLVAEEYPIMNPQSPLNETRQIIGFISGFIKSLYPWFKTKSVGHISYLIVDKIHRRKCVGKRLEESAIKWFQSKNVSYMEVYVEELNTVGKIAWEHYGYLPFKKFLRKKI